MTAAVNTEEGTMVDPTGSAPERSLVQRMEALKLANEIRTKRATFKRDLKAGNVTIIDTFIDPPGYLRSARVLDVLLATPKYGRVKANKILQLARVSPSKTLGGLSPRQRTEVASMLRGTWSTQRPDARPLIIQAVTAAATQTVVPPTDYERRVLALAAGTFGEVNQSNVNRAATALGSNPSAVIRACRDLQRKGLLDLTGRPTRTGHQHASVLAAASGA